MSSLKERLLRLKGAAAVRSGMDNGEAVRVHEPEDGGAEHNACVEGSFGLTEPGWSELGGVRLEHNSYGSFLLRERIYEPEHRHGRLAVGDLYTGISQLSPLTGGASLKLEELLFFDTETTGLGIGAGNVPFLIGVGFYRDCRFIVQQLFIRNPAEEAAMLAYFEDLLQRFTHIVSYNGRSFDWPIVKSRFVLARRKLEDVWHQIDLLYPARSLWKSVLVSCRLSCVEAEKIGFRRKDDVPGSMAPVLYVQYLAEKDPQVIGGVFVHNEHDIVSLAALAVHMAQLLQGEPVLDDFGDEELLRLASWLDKMKRTEQAECIRNKLVERLTGSVLCTGRERVLLQLASDFKKRARYDRAAELWLLFIAARGAGFACPVEPYIELSMHYEHRERCFDKALFYAEEALNRIWKRMSLTHIGDQQRIQIEAIQHRIRRLRDKLRRELGKSEHPRNSESLKAACVAEAAPSWSKQGRPKRNKPEYVIESLV